MKIYYLSCYSIILLLSGCAILPPRPMPLDAKISFNNETHVVNKGMGYSGAGGSVNIGGKNYYFLYRRIETFKDEIYGVIIGVKCEKKYKDIHVCMLFQKKHGISMYSSKPSLGSDDEWELLPICGLYIDGFAETTPCEKKNTYVAKQIEIKRDIEKEIADRRKKRVKQNIKLYTERLQKNKSQKLNSERDKNGRKIIRGPVSGGYYNNVHIISDSVGVIAFGPTTITNSVIEASVCVRSSGKWLKLNNNILKCKLCVEFIGNSLFENELKFNQCEGNGTNRPDVFGW